LRWRAFLSSQKVRSLVIIPVKKTFIANAELIKHESLTHNQHADTNIGNDNNKINNIQTESPTNPVEKVVTVFFSPTFLTHKFHLCSHTQFPPHTQFIYVLKKIMSKWIAHHTQLPAQANLSLFAKGRLDFLGRVIDNAIQQSSNCHDTANDGTYFGEECKGRRRSLSEGHSNWANVVHKEHSC
jgi:hypothetical protein